MKEIIAHIEKMWFSQTKDNEDISYRFTDGVIHSTIGASHKFKNVKILKLYVVNTETFSLVRYKNFTGTYKEILQQLQQTHIQENL